MLEKRFEEALHCLKSAPKHYSPQTIIPLIDLTLLQDEAPCETIVGLAQAAIKHHTANICILATHLQCLPNHLVLRCATVANFPSGNETQASIMHSIDIALHDRRCMEIDYVFPYQLYLQGRKQEALNKYHEIATYAKQQGLLLKVILETGAFTHPADIYALCLELIAKDCTFLKTSTGKIAQGASLSAAFAMLSAIQEMKRPCGIKFSGGIKTAQQASEYLQLAEMMLGRMPDPSWCRLGASSLLNDLLTNH